MAVVIFDSTNASYDGNLTTANGAYRVESHNLASMSATDLALSTLRTISVTFANAGNCQGIVLPLSGTANGGSYKSVKVDLKEGATIRATVTLTGAQIADSTANYISEGGYIVPFVFATPYAVTTAAATWSFDISQTGAQTSTWNVRTSNATAPAYATWCDNKVTAASGDTFIFKDKTTFNAGSAFTFGPTLGTGDAANGICAWVCKSSTPPTLAGANSNFQWDATAARTLNIDGMFILGAHSGVQICSASSRPSFANKWTINFVNRSSGTTASGIYSPEGATGSNDRKMSFWAYGAAPTVRKCLLNADAAVAATTFTTSTDVSSWQSGWGIYVGKQNVKGQGSTTVHTLNGVPVYSGGQSTVTVTPALATNVRKSGGTAFVFSGAYAGNIISNTTNRGGIVFRGASNFVIDEVYMEEFSSASTLNFSSTNPVEDAANASQYQVKNCAAYGTPAVSTTGLFAGIAIPPAGLLIDGNYCFRTGVTITLSYQAGLSGVTTFQNNYTGAGSSGAGFSVNTRTVVQNNTFSNFSNATALTVQGVGVTCKTNTFWGCAGSSTTSALVVSGAVNSASISGNTFNNCTNAILFGANTNVQHTDLNSTFGNETANTNDFLFQSDGYVQYLSSTPTGTLTVDTTTLQNNFTGSWLRVKNYNATTGDYRSWYPEGRFVNSGSNLICYPYQAVDTTTLRGRFYLGSASVSTFPVSIATTLTIANAGYYGGSIYTLPTLAATYDNLATTATQAAAASTSAQAISVSFTPTLDNSDIQVDLLTNSDNATEANRAVTFTPPVLRVRKYGYTFYENTLTVQQTTDDKLFSVPTPAANPFTVLSQAAAHALTGISYNSGTNTITISSNHTLSEIYDYFQDWGTLNQTSSLPFDTADGTTYTSTANITVNTGVTLSGAGKIISLSAYTFTLTGTASFDGVYIDTTGRNVPIALTGIVSGSTVQLYNSTASSEIYNAVVSATSKIVFFTYTADKALRVRVRKAGKQPYEATGTISSTGFSLVVSQEIDTIYVANGIDGSTITDCAFSGATVKIYVTEPTNQIDARNIYAWYCYATATTTYIGLQPFDITAQTSYSYVYTSPLTIHNQNVAVLTIYNANIIDDSGGAGWIDVPGTIILNSYFPLPDLSSISNALTVDDFLALK